VHAERLINKLIGFNDEQRSALKAVRDQIWTLYAQLKLYKQSPTEALRKDIEVNFDKIFTHKACFETLNQALTRLQRSKVGLLIGSQIEKLGLGFAHNSQVGDKMSLALRLPLA
jgi:hypothetical protein